MNECMYLCMYVCMYVLRMYFVRTYVPELWRERCGKVSGTALQLNVNCAYYRCKKQRKIYALS
jgi:hypothetical protein